MLRSKPFLTLAIAMFASFLLVAQAQAGKIKYPAPTAVHNGPWAAAPTEVITFSGAGSSSSNGQIYQYCWTFGDGTPQVCSSGQTASHAYTVTGNFNVTLTVTDTAYQTGSATGVATITYTTPGTQPDLVVTDITGASRGNTGNYVPVSVTIQNTGWATATGTAWLSIYLSTDPTITVDDYKRATIYVTNLAVGQSVTYNTEILLMGSIPQGTYYYGAVADELDAVVESNEGNNTLSGNTIQIRPQK